MTRQERLKRNYAILMNITGDSKLSNRAKHWGDTKVYKELNIYIPDYKTKAKTTLKPRTAKHRNRVLKSAENKYKYAIKMGISPENAEIVKYQTYKVIDLQLQYQLFFKPKYNRLSFSQKETRIKQWKEWSSKDEYPPVMVYNARLLNKSTNLDINDSYGFGIYWYNFTTNQSIEKLIEQFKPDKASGMIIYETERPLRR